MKRMFSRVIGVNVDISSADVKVVLSFCMMAIWRGEYGDMTCIVDFTSYALLKRDQPLVFEIACSYNYPCSSVFPNAYVGLERHICPDNDGDDDSCRWWACEG